MFDKRLLFIVAGLLVIMYLVLNKAQPEIVQGLRDRVTSLATGKPANGAPVSADADGQWSQQRQGLLAARVADSKRRAIAKYPDIAVANTEMNSRFVFRYKGMVKDNSERLKNPNWPEMLAEDCAAASGPHANPTRPAAPPPKDGAVVAR